MLVVGNLWMDVSKLPVHMHHCLKHSRCSLANAMSLCTTAKRFVMGTPMVPGRTLANPETCSNHQVLVKVGEKEMVRSDKASLIDSREALRCIQSPGVRKMSLRLHTSLNMGMTRCRHADTHINYLMYRQKKSSRTHPLVPLVLFDTCQRES